MKPIATLVTLLTMGASIAQSYDPSTEVTFEGKVLGILTTPEKQTNILVKSSNGGASLVVLGPQEWVSRQRVKIAMKDELKITGSKITLANKRTAILAATVTKNGQTLTIRDEKGTPLYPMPVETSDVPNRSTHVGNTTVIGGEVIDLSNAESARLVVSTPEGDVQVQLGQDWYLSNQRSTYTINELLAMNGVFHNIGLPGPVILLPQSGRDKTLFLTPGWRF